MKKSLRLISVVLVMLFAASSMLQAQATYVGSTACGVCHTDKYDSWSNTGHPYKFSVIENEQPPWYPPMVVNFEDSWIANLGDGSHTWADIAGVIGGYGWKARFVGTDGYIIGTAGSSFPDAGGGHNQFNFYGGVDYGWVDYETSNDHKVYNYACFKCHTTGGDTTGTWLAGVDGLGTFTEGGIGCEGCHGPGSEHIAAPSSSNIDKVYEMVHQDNSLGGLETDGVLQTPDPNGNDINFMCGTCHNRSYTNPINASGGFIKHHEQWDEFTHTNHFDNGFNCVTCHDPHERTIWDGDGIKMACATCHTTEVETINHGDGAGCIDCHMPFAAKSGTTRGESGYKGDVRSHLFTITVDTANMFTADGSNVRDDDERPASLSPAYVCLGCHNDDPNDDIPDKTLEQAVAQAKDMHEPTFVNNVDAFEMNVYPNPTTGATKITFTAEETASVRIYSITGQLVFNMEDMNDASGNYIVNWNGLSNTGSELDAGYYFVKISAGNKTATKKLVMMK